LTRELDILPALGGLASMMQKKGLGNYLAGLRENDIAHGLMWIIAVRKYQVSSGYRGPSCSWVSNKGQVYWSFDSENAVTAVKLIDSDVQVSMLNAFREIYGSSLVISGTVIKGRLEWFWEEQYRMDFVKLHLDTHHKLYGAALNT
jgi:hypothetical protein